MTIGIVLHLIPTFSLVLYGAATAYYLRYLVQRSERCQRQGRQALLGGFLLHALFLVITALGFSFTSAPLVQHHDAPISYSFAFSMSLVGAVLTAFFLLSERVLKFSGLGGFVAPMSLVFMTFSSILFHEQRSPFAASSALVLLWFHVIVAVLGNAAFASSFLVSVALVGKEHLLRRKKHPRFQQLLPALETLDRINSLLLIAGILLMTLAVGLGLMFAATNKLSFFEFDPRLLWSVLVLLTYAALVTSRFSIGMRGAHAGWFSIVGFVVLLASFIGVRFVGTSFHIH